MYVNEVCNTDVEIISQEASAAEAARQMRRAHVGALVVMADPGDAGSVVGMVTDRDLVIEVLAMDIDPSEVSVGDIITRELLFVNADADIEDALELMARQGVRRLPVFNGEGLLEGVLALDDILWVQAQQLSSLVRVIGRERRNEEHLRPA
jgi:CBS domain-containing protein